MEIKINDQFIIATLRHFQRPMIEFSYKLSSVVYNDRDGNYIEYIGMGVKNKNYRISISINNINEINILLIRPKKYIHMIRVIFFLFLAFVGLRRINPGQVGVDSVELKSLQNFIPNKLDEDNIEIVIKQSIDFIQQHLMSVIKGEVWIEEPR